MGGARNQRSRNSLTFLEHVCDLLHSLQADIDVIKSSIAGIDVIKSSIECLNIDRQVGLSYRIPYHESLTTLDDLRPPVAPPPLDIYDRNFLLCFRGIKDDSLEHTLVKTSPIAAESGTTTDWDSLKFELDELDAPTLPTRVWYDPDEITAFVAEVSNTTEETSDDKQSVETRKQDDLLKSIWNAQHNAKRRRWNEDRSQAISKPVQVIQGFWRTCKSKLAKRTTEANKVEVNMDKAKLATNFPVHVGSCGTAMDSRVRGAVHKTPILSEEPRSGSSHSYELEQPSRVDIWKRYEEHHFLPAIPISEVVDQETKKAIAKRKLGIPIYRTSNPTLYETQSVKTPNAGSLKGIRSVAHEYRPYICEDCASYSDSNDFCNFCGGCKLTESVCVCSHAGSCGIGSCHASDEASHASELEDSEYYTESDSDEIYYICLVCNATHQDERLTCLGCGSTRLEARKMTENTA